MKHYLSGLPLIFLFVLPTGLCAHKKHKKIVKLKLEKIIVAGKASGGRLGDNVLLYCKAKYFSYKQHIPFAYRNFPFFGQLALSQYDNTYLNEFEQRFPVKVLVQDKHVFADDKKKSTMYEVDYFCQMRKNKNNEDAYVGCGEFPFDWITKKMMKYPEFGNELRRNLQILNHDILQIPEHALEDYVTVAVTTRMGCGGDDPFLYSKQFFDEQSLRSSANGFHDRHADGGNPFKFVPQQFYVNQVKRLSELLHHRPMKIYYFVDRDREFTEDLLNKWRVALADYKNISIECTQEKNWDQRTLDDLALISKCDCLIRGCSHFSGVAQLVGQHRIIMGPDPVSAVWLDPKHLVFKRTFIYFQNIKEHKFEQYVVEEMDKNILHELIDKYVVS